MTTKTTTTARIASDAVITVKKAHDFVGYRGTAFDCLKSGITVEKFRAAIENAGLTGYSSWVLRTALASGVIAVKAPKAKAVKAAQPKAELKSEQAVAA